MLARNDVAADPLILIAELAEVFEASVSEQDIDTLVVDVRLRLADGSTMPYRLSINSAGSKVSVREKIPTRLPGACPNRHINPDGSFCTHWGGFEQLDVSSAEDARRWWEKLLAYLRVQERVTVKRKWPNQKEWAHGGAAAHQLAAEIAASALGAPYDALLAKGKLEVQQPRGSRFLSLWSGRQRLVSIWKREGRPATLKQRCPCGSYMVLRECGEHAKRTVNLVNALWAMKEADKRFWASLKGQPCCGTLDSCPLKQK